MNKIQKVCLVFVIFAVLNYALHTLLGISLFYDTLHDESTIEKIFALVSGICGFISITIFSNQEA